MYLFLFSRYFGHPCAHHQEKITVSMRHWYLSLVWVVSGLLVGLKIQPADQTPPIQSGKYQCRIDTVIFSWWWAHGYPKHLEKRNKYTKQKCAPTWTYLQNIIEGSRVNKTLKKKSGTVCRPNKQGQLRLCHFKLITTVILIFVPWIFTVRISVSGTTTNFIKEKYLVVIVPVFPFALLTRVSAKNCLRTNLGLASRPHPWSSINSCPIDVCRKLQTMFLFTGGQCGDTVTTLS